MLNGDREYYARRIAEERAAAESSPCEMAREVHLDLAERYSAKLHLIESVLAERPFSRAGSPPPRRASAASRLSPAAWKRAV